MTEIPQIGRSFQVTTKGVNGGIRIIRSTTVLRVMCVFPRTVWVETDLTTFRIEVLQQSERSAATFLRWLPFIRKP